MSHSSTLLKSGGAWRFWGAFSLCFLVPWVLAKMTLDFSWATPGVTNKGQWLDHDVRLLDPIALHSPANWYLVYIVPSRCGNNCQQSLYYFQQLYRSFGAQRRHIAAIVISDHTEFQQRYPDLVNASSALQLPMSWEGHFYIANNNGVVLLSYSQKETQSLPILCKNLRSDMQRLLAFDRERL